jgi:hypothetical protein
MHLAGRANACSAKLRIIMPSRLGYPGRSGKGFNATEICRELGWGCSQGEAPRWSFGV